MRDGKWKLVVDRRTGEKELFDTASDQNEKQNVASKNASVTGNPPWCFGVLRNLGKQKAANLP